MALATRCPHCRTTFRVTNDQLKLREGLVRCGTCREVFDGRLYLIDVPSAAAARTSAARKGPQAKKRLAGPPSRLSLPAPFAEAADDDNLDEIDSAFAEADETHSADPSTADKINAVDTPSGLTPEEILSLPVTESLEVKEADPSKLVVEEVDADQLALNDYAAWAATHAAPVTNPSDASRSDAAWLDDAVRAAVELAEGRKKKPEPPSALPESSPTDVPDVPAHIAATPVMGEIDLSDLWADSDKPQANDDANPLNAALKAAEAARELEERLSNELAESAARTATQETAGNNAGGVANDAKDEDPVFLEKFVVAPSQPTGKAEARPVAGIDPKWPTINAAQPLPGTAAPTDPTAAPRDHDVAPEGTIITTPDWMEEDEALYAEEARREQEHRAQMHAQQEQEHQQLSPPTLIHKADDIDVSELEPDFFARAQQRDNEPAFVVQARLQDFNSYRRRGLTTVGSVILGILLIFQSAHFFRDSLSVHYPSLRGPLTALCKMTGCHISLPRLIDGIAVEANELRSIDPRTSHFALTMLLRNQSGVRETWPDVELTLNDSNDQVVSRRVFAPAEYLPPGINVDNGFENKGEQPVRIDFELKQGRAAGYRVAIFYR